MKKIILILVLALVPFFLSAQDTVLVSPGAIILVKAQECPPPPPPDTVLVENPTPMPFTLSTLFVNETGAYQVLATFENGDTVTVPLEVEVPDCPEQTINTGGFAIVPNQGAGIYCTGSYVVLHVEGPTPITSYLWNGYYNDAVQVVSTNSSGIKNYSCRVKNNSTGLDTVLTYTVYVYTPLPSVSVATPDGDEFCEPITIGTDVDDPNGHFQYQWYRNNLPVFGAINPVYLVTTTGDYKVRVTNPCGPVVSQNVHIVISDCITGIQEHGGSEKIGVEISPNPAFDHVTVKMSEQGHYSSSLFNSLGQMIQQNEGGSETVVPLDGFPAGLYCLQVFSKGRLIATKKIIKN